MELIKDCYLTKSFYCIGYDLKKCLGCDYCRLLNNETKGFNLTKLPTEINPVLNNIPVAVNLFYGDPMVQPMATIDLLKRLEDAEHKGPVIIITKAPVNHLKGIVDLNLDIHFCLSTFGVDHPMDGGSRATFEFNLTELYRAGIRSSIEFRPIIYGINDSEESLNYVFSMAKMFNVPIGYSGMQGKPEILAHLKAKGLDISPYPGKEFHTHKKIIGADIEARIIELSKEYDIPAFRKTSCLISYQHNMARDYNAHYYRANEVGCSVCPMEERCKAFKASLNDSVYEYTKAILPYEHEIVTKKNHVCTLAKQGICESVTPDCFKIKGTLIKTDIPLTTSDVRLTKWLTGLTMEVKMEEKYMLSSFWQK